MKKHLERCKHCALVVVRQSQNFFALPQTPFLGVQDGKNLISHLQTQFGEDRCMQFRVIVVTDPQTNPQTDRTDNNTLHR